jgi:hypothetical protein
MKEKNMFGRMKQNFVVDQKVIIGQTTSPELDGMGGTILGKSVEDVSDVYIVMLDGPLSYSDDKAITLTEVCLAPAPLLAND